MLYICKMLAGFTNKVDEFTTTILQLKKVLVLPPLYVPPVTVLM